MTAVAWALDATRRWCLGLADREEVEDAADAAYAAYAVAAYDAYDAYDAYAAADAARRRLVDAVRGVVWGHPTTSGYVVSPTHVWVPRDVAWGRWVPRLELTPEDAVLADVALEAA